MAVQNLSVLVAVLLAPAGGHGALAEQPGSRHVSQCFETSPVCLAAKIGLQGLLGAALESEAGLQMGDLALAQREGVAQASVLDLAVAWNLLGEVPESAAEALGAAVPELHFEGAAVGLQYCWQADLGLHL